MNELEELKKQVVELKQQLEQLQARFERFLEVHELWDGS